MSGFGPVGGGGNPFEGIFGDIARVLSSGQNGPLNWDVARQTAVMLAGNGQAEANIEPLERIRHESLVRVAELHVREVLPFDVEVSDFIVTNRTNWAVASLDAWKPLLTALATSLSQTQDSADAGPAAFDPGNPMAALANMEKFMGPVLLGMQVGGMVGQLAQRALGQYDFPIPRANNGVAFIAPNITQFAKDWSLPVEELTLYACVEEVARASIMSRPHVGRRFQSLLMEYAEGFRPDTVALQDRLGEMDLSDPENLPSMLNDPQQLLGALQTDGQRQTLQRISALLAAYMGYVDHVVDVVAAKVIPSVGTIEEAVKRRRVEETDGQRLAEQLLGLELSQTTFDRGTSFVNGVLERAGEEGLARLWKSELELPTPADVDAPGLWLARIDLPADS